jgi:dolichyl-phosphate beta-glucosyltransferase
MDFSIVIPVLNEHSKIVKDITGASAFLTTTFETSEIIIVDDGSTDGSSALAHATETASNVHLTVLTHERRHGKGHAVRTGIAASTGRQVMFADSGSCVPWHFINRGISLLKSGSYQIANASRKLPESKIVRAQPVARRVNSYLFRLFLIYYMGVPKRFTDTQCGFKIYNGEIARELYSDCITDGFTFDVEILLLALKKGCRAKEFAIEWTADPDSRLGQTLSIPGILQELKSIKTRLA